MIEQVAVVVALNPMMAPSRRDADMSSSATRMPSMSMILSPSIGSSA